MAGFLLGVEDGGTSHLGRRTVERREQVAGPGVVGPHLVGTHVVRADLVGAHLVQRRLVIRPLGVAGRGVTPCFAIDIGLSGPGSAPGPGPDSPSSIRGKTWESTTGRA